MMSYQAYIDNIKTKTGMTPDDFKTLAREKGFLKPGVKVGEIVAWLKEDFGLGQGHAMAIVLALKEDNAPKLSLDERIDHFFTSSRSNWRGTYAQLMKKIEEFGGDVNPDPTDTYISLLKGNKKFAVLAFTTDRMDIGIKLKGVTPGARLEAAGSWNSMVTHRVRITAPSQVDNEVLTWLKNAYDAA
jgi:hypothetical protein